MEEFRIIKSCTEHQNYSYKALNEKLVHSNFRLSLFNGTIITNSSFNDCNFGMVELQGTQIFNTLFDNCNFENADMKSSLFKNTIFNEVNFNFTNIKDCTFEDCKFEKCLFEGTNMTENTFLKCHYKHIDLSKSYGFLNEFINNIFSDLLISGSFYFSIFFENILRNCELDSYLLGYIYGLSTCTTEESIYQLIDNKKTNDLSFAIDCAYQMYNSRFMYMNLGFLELLDNKGNLEKSIYMCIGYLAKSLDQEIIIKSEESNFLKKILNLEFKNNNISPFAMLTYHNALTTMLKENISANEKSIGLIRNLKNQAYLMYSQYLNELSNLNFYNLDGRKFTLHIKYLEKPAVPLEKILNSINLGLKVENAEVIRTEKGSYLEWLSCIPEILPYIQLFVDIMGITVPIVVYKNSKKEILKKKSNELSLYDEDSMMHITIKDIANNGKKIEPLIKVLKTEKFSVNTQKNGYTKKNVTEIRITY